jgi:CO/xanthine dehydrogenase FAD-binding subunit
MGVEFYRPKTLDELLTLRVQYPNAAIIAGGTDLLVYARAGKITPEGYLDITGIKDLRGVREQGDEIVTAAATTFTDAEQSLLLQRHLPCLCHAAASVGSPQIRNRGTLGGSLVNANPSGDIAPVLVAVQARVVLRSQKGSRALALEDFITGNGVTVLEPDEILQEIVWAKLKPGVKMFFEKVGRRNALAVARLNGVCVLWEKDGAVEEIRISIGSATNRPIRMSAAESFLQGRRPGPGDFEKAGRIISDTILGHTGRRHSSDYKLPVAAEMSARLIRKTWESEALACFNPHPAPSAG